MKKEGTLKAGVIGLGIMGNHHLRILSNLVGVGILGVYDVLSERRDEIAEKRGCQSFESIEQMLDAKPDFVVVATPTPTHAEIAMGIMERRIPLLLEKPIAHDLEEGLKLKNYATEHQIPVMVGHVERHNPAVQKLKELIDDGNLGRMFKIYVKRIGPYPPSVGGVVNIDLAVHDLDVVRYLTGAKVNFQFAMGSSIIDGRLDTADMFIQLDNGATVNLSADWISPRKVRELTVVGEKGMFVLDYLQQTLIFYENPPGGLTSLGYSDIMRGLHSGNSRGYAIRQTEPLKVQDTYFVDGVIRRGNRPSPTLDEALDALRYASKIDNKY